MIIQSTEKSLKLRNKLKNAKVDSSYIEIENNNIFNAIKKSKLQQKNLTLSSLSQFKIWRFNE